MEFSRIQNGAGQTAMEMPRIHQRMGRIEFSVGTGHQTARLADLRDRAVWCTGLDSANVQGESDLGRTTNPVRAEALGT